MSNNAMYTHHQKTIILDAPMDSPEAVAAAAKAAEEEAARAAAAKAAAAAAAAAPAASSSDPTGPATLDSLDSPHHPDSSSGKAAGGGFISRKLKEYKEHHHKGSDKDLKAGESEQRRVIAFIGGLDLTDGRYDTPDHPLFDTLGPDGVHNKDFYNICIDGACGRDATLPQVALPK